MYTLAMHLLVFCIDPHESGSLLFGVDYAVCSTLHAWYTNSTRSWVESCIKSPMPLRHGMKYELRSLLERKVIRNRQDKTIRS